MASHIEALDRVLEPLQGQLSEELAKAVLSLEFPKSDHDRVAELSYKVQEGALTPEEEAELDWYLHLGSFLTILKAKAHMALRRRSPAA